MRIVPRPRGVVLQIERDTPGQLVIHSFRQFGPHGLVSFGCRAGDEQGVAGRGDPPGDGGDLGRGLALAEDDFREALAGIPLMVDPGEAQILVRFLAQNLKEPLLRRLRSKGSGAHVVEQGANLQPVHRAWKVDFSPTWTIRSLIGPRD